MTLEEWNQKHFIMDWSIHDHESWREYCDTEFATAEEEQKAFRSIKLDLRAPKGTPDGLHTLLCLQGGEEGRTAGVIVRNGEFIPENIAAACLEAVCHSYGITSNDVRTGREGIDHVFIEQFNWHPDARRLEVHVGS